MFITKPVSPDDYVRYFHFRWKMLRAPWNQPIGSEKDEFEDSAFHIMASDINGQIIGVGRLHKIDHATSQIRYMAVAGNHQKMGIGSGILGILESQARRDQSRTIILNARDTALAFYHRHGYEVIAKGHTLYSEITHTQMQKIL